MAWRLRYTANIDWVPEGIGLMTGALSPLQGNVGGAGPAQTLKMLNTQGGQFLLGAGTTPSTGALASSDITTLTNGMASDISTQLSASLTRINQFLVGEG